MRGMHAWRRESMTMDPHQEDGPHSRTTDRKTEDDDNTTTKTTTTLTQRHSTSMARAQVAYNDKYTSYSITKLMSLNDLVHVKRGKVGSGYKTFTKQAGTRSNHQRVLSLPRMLDAFCQQ